MYMKKKSGLAWTIHVSDGFNHGHWVREFSLWTNLEFCSFSWDALLNQPENWTPWKRITNIDSRYSQWLEQLMPFASEVQPFCTMHFWVPCLSFLWGYLSFHKQTHEHLIQVSLTLKEETKHLGTPFFTAQLDTPFFLRTLKTSKKMRCLWNFDLLPFNPKSRVTFWDRALGWDWPTWSPVSSPRRCQPKVFERCRETFEMSTRLSFARGVHIGNRLQVSFFFFNTWRTGWAVIFSSNVFVRLAP